MASCDGFPTKNDMLVAKQSIDHISHVAKSRDSFNNPADSVTDPIGDLTVTNRTLDGLEKLYYEAISKAGYILIDSFNIGANLTLPNQVLRWAIADGGNGEYYRWDGIFPKSVPAGSTPASTGGVALGAWVGVGDASLRAALASHDNGQGATLIADLSGTTVQSFIDKTNSRITYVTPEMFGAVGDGVADDTAAIQAAIDAALVSPFRPRVIGGGIYGVSGSIYVDNFSRGFLLDLAGIVAISTFPTPSSWLLATSAILIGEKSNGSQVGINIKIGYFNGADKSTLFRLSGFGAGGSRFHAGRVQNVIGVYQVGDHVLKSPSASNFITGDYWYDGIFGARIGRNGSYIAEGHKVEVGFITGMKYGGTQLRNGSQYTQVSGDLDFNGRYLSEITISGTSFTNLVRGAMISNGTTTGEVLSFYQQKVGVFAVLIIESRDVSGGNSSFAAGNTVTSGSWSSTVTSVNTANQGSSNFYFDVILDFNGSPFARVAVNSGYVGGVVGNSLFSSDINYKNSYNSYTNSVNGATWVHSGTTMTLFDLYLSRSVFDCTTDYIAPGTNTYTRSYRTYGAEYAAVFAPAQTRNIRTFVYSGSTNAPGMKDIYDIQIFGPTGLSGVCSSIKVAVSPSGLEIYENNVNPISTLTFYTNGLTLQARQDSSNTFTIYFTFNRK